MVLLHICGALDIFLLFCDQQDTESNKSEMEVGVAGPILTQKKQRLYGQMMSILYKMGENIVTFLHIYGARAIYYYFVITKTLNLINDA